MICVSIAQNSHRLALADMLNAARRCDLIEIRLDRFENPPNIKELRAACRKPAIISCRRRSDGGEWDQPEPARLSLLRQAVLEGADYVEIESDCAGQIRRYGKTKRIVAYTNTEAVPEQLDEIYRQACAQDPDVIKLTLPTRTPEEAFPLIRIVAKGKVPTVAVGWGRSGLMLNVLGRRYKAPWTYAALEKGMEAYPGMATISELEEIYDYQQIDSKTPLLAVTGFSEEQLATARLLNHGFRLAGNKTRCLPLEIGNMELFQEVVGAIKLAGVIVDDGHREQVLRVLTKRTGAVELAGAADFVVINKDQWLGFNTLSRAVVGCMEAALKERYPAAEPLKSRTFIVVGCSGTARSIAASIRKQGGLVVIADKDAERAKRLAREIGARFVPAVQVYGTMCDGMVLCLNLHDPRPGESSVEIPANLGREGMLGIDLTDFPYETPFLKLLRLADGIVVRPVDIFIRMMQSILKVCTGQVFTTAQLREPLKEMDFQMVYSDEEDEPDQQDSEVEWL